MARTRDVAARRRVLTAARDLVCEMGPRTVTVDQIAAAAGVGKQTIYRWWPTKSSVVMDALIELTDPDPVDLPGSTYEAVRLQMRRVARMFASRNGELIRELVADAQGDPALAQRLPRPFLCPPPGQRRGHPGQRNYHGRAAARPGHRRRPRCPLWPPMASPAYWAPPHDPGRGRQVAGLRVASAEERTVVEVGCERERTATTSRQHRREPPRATGPAPSGIDRLMG